MILIGTCLLFSPARFLSRVPKQPLTGTSPGYLSIALLFSCFVFGCPCTAFEVEDIPQDRQKANEKEGKADILLLNPVTFDRSGATRHSLHLLAKSQVITSPENENQCRSRVARGSLYPL